MDLLRFGRLFNKGSQERGYEMKSLFAVVASMLIALPALAQVKPCEELKSEIETKIKNNGVNAFTPLFLILVSISDLSSSHGFTCAKAGKAISIDATTAKRHR